LKWAVLTDTLDGEYKLEVFNDHTKAFSYFVREVIRLLEGGQET